MKSIDLTQPPIEAGRLQTPQQVAAWVVSEVMEGIRRVRHGGAYGYEQRRDYVEDGSRLSVQLEVQPVGSSFNVRVRTSCPALDDHLAAATIRCVRLMGVKAEVTRGQCFMVVPSGFPPDNYVCGQPEPLVPAPETTVTAETHVRRLLNQAIAEVWRIWRPAKRAHDFPDRFYGQMTIEVMCRPIIQPRRGEAGEFGVTIRVSASGMTSEDGDLDVIDFAQLVRDYQLEQTGRRTALGGRSFKMPVGLSAD